MWCLWIQTQKVEARRSSELMWDSSECEQVRDSGNCMEQTVYNRAVGKLQILLWRNLCWSWKLVLQNRTYVSNRKEERNAYWSMLPLASLLPYILCLAHCGWLSALGSAVRGNPVPMAGHRWKAFLSSCQLYVESFLFFFSFHSGL